MCSVGSLATISSPRHRPPVVHNPSTAHLPAPSCRQPVDDFGALAKDYDGSAFCPRCLTILLRCPSPSIRPDGCRARIRNDPRLSRVFVPISVSIGRGRSVVAFCAVSGLQAVPVERSAPAGLPVPRDLAREQHRLLLPALAWRRPFGHCAFVWVSVHSSERPSRFAAGTPSGQPSRLPNRLGAGES